MRAIAEVQDWACLDVVTGSAWCVDERKPVVVSEKAHQIVVMLRGSRPADPGRREKAASGGTVAELATALLQLATGKRRYSHSPVQQLAQQ